MPDFLSKIPFTEQLLSAVQQFDCGNEEWEAPMADWIKAGPEVKNGALWEIRKRKGKLQVWLHTNGGNQLVGYSSLGQSNWEWPTPDDPRVPISVIPYVAIQQRFWGLPKDPPKYSQQIFEHLVYEARAHSDRQPLLGLFVHPRNDRAIAAYTNLGFEPFSRPFAEDGVSYLSMLLALNRSGAG